MKRPSMLLHDNSSKLIAVSFLVGFVVWYGIEKTFLRQDLGVGAQGIAAIVITYIVVALLLDVPAGILADRWSRKKVMFLSIVFFAIADVILGASVNFAMYLVGTIFWGFFTVCMYGTNESLTFDSLREIKKEDKYRRVDAAQRGAFMIGIFLSSVSSSVLVKFFDIRLNYFVSLAPLALAAFLVLKIVEPRFYKVEERVSVLTHTRKTFGSLLTHAVLLKLTMITVTVLVIENAFFEYSQYYYLALFGSVSVAAALNGSSGLAMVVGYRFSEKIVRFQPLILLTGALLWAAAAWRSQWVIIVFFMAYPLIAIVENGAQAAVQANTTSAIRASVTSAINFTGNLVVVPFTIIFAHIAEGTSIYKAYTFAAIVFTVAGLFFMFDKTHRVKLELTPEKAVNEYVVK